LADWLSQRKVKSQHILKREGCGGYICQKCGIRGGNLNAHHTIPFKKIINRYNITTIEEAKNCSLLFDINNVVTLCEDCHRWVHSNKNINEKFIRVLEKEITLCQTVDGCQT
jgi:5-methylcytosine-specific restriction endonuclease McrA